jgi:6-pyruvoyltetrahydropterin/6-carboxytetrahydropterin synthase
MTIYKEFTFDAAHRLTRVPPEHKCAALHGHTYRLVVFISGPPDHRGFCGGADYSEIKEAVDAVLRLVDHKCLNDLVENPTTEAMVKWLWPRLETALPGLSLIELKESATTGCIYRGEE